MHKITTFSRQPQYVQLLNLTNRAKIREISVKKAMILLQDKKKTTTYKVVVTVGGLRL